MSVKNVLLIALVLANLVLVTGVILQIDPPAADAQVIGANYAVVTAQTQGGEDALWVLELGSRKLYALRLPRGNDKVMELIGDRDVERDLRGR